MHQNVGNRANVIGANQHSDQGMESPQPLHRSERMFKTNFKIGRVHPVPEYRWEEGRETSWTSEKVAHHARKSMSGSHLVGAARGKASPQGRTPRIPRWGGPPSRCRFLRQRYDCTVRLLAFFSRGCFWRRRDQLR